MLGSAGRAGLRRELSSDSWDLVLEAWERFDLLPMREARSGALEAEASELLPRLLLPRLWPNRVGLAELAVFRWRIPEVLSAG